MLRALLPLATLRIKALRRPPLDAPSRANALAWLSYAAPRFAGRTTRSLATLAALLILAFLTTAASTLVLAYFNYTLINDSAPESLTELLDDALEYDPEPYIPIALVAIVFLMAFGVLALLLWLRLGCLAALRARALCAHCSHDLTALPIRADNSVQCPECARLAHPIAPWDELASAVSTESGATFRPNLTLAPRLWTRRRLKIAGLGIASLALLAALSYGVRWLYIDIDARRQAAQARAARLSPEEITRRVTAGHVRPPKREPGCVELVSGIASKANSLSKTFNDSLGRTATSGENAIVYVDEYPDRTDGTRDAVRSALALELLMLFRAKGIFDLLDQLPDSDLWVEFEYVPPEFAATNKNRPLSASDLRVALRIGYARTHWARMHSDLVEFKASIRSLVALVNLAGCQRSTVDHLVRSAAEASLLDKVAPIMLERPTADWLDTIEHELSLIRHESMSSVFDRERLYMLDLAAMHFSDSARIKRGMTDPLLQQSLGFAFVSTTADSEDSTVRLGSFAQNQSALNELFDSLVARSRSRPFERLPLLLPEPRSCQLAFCDQMEPVYAKMLDSADRLAIMRQALSMLLLLERYRLANRGYPTSDEFAMHFAHQPSAIDPYTGRLLLYRRVDPEPRLDLPGYELWSTGADTIDNNGNFAKFGYQALRQSGAGTDYLLSAPERW